MARDYYESTIALPDATAGYVLKSLAGVKVSVVPRGTIDAEVATAAAATSIYQAATGAAKGPDPKSGASGTNPLTTNASGSVRFWADGPLEYDLVYEDTIVPARVTDRVGWNCIPAKAGAFPTSYLAADGGIKQAHLHPEVVNNEVPIGGVIEWWRPNNTPAVPTPVGYVVCDGVTTVPAGQHDFPVAGAITVPDLRNMFILGADHTKASGAGAGGGDAAADAPGIHGTGGNNAVALAVTHLPVHKHTLTDNGHIHGCTDAGQHGHTLVIDPNQVTEPPYRMPASPSGWYWDYAYKGLPGVNIPATTGSTIIDASGQHGHTGYTLQAGLHGHDIQSHGIGIAATNDAGSGTAHNNMPKWFGLLRVMKVRRV